MQFQVSKAVRFAFKARYTYRNEGGERQWHGEFDGMIRPRKSAVQVNKYPAGITCSHMPME